MARTQVIGLISAIIILGFVLDLVRRRRLREEYSWLWLMAALLYLMIALFPGIADWISRIIGTSNTSMALIFLGLLFIVLLLIQYSIWISRLTNRVKNLTQLTSILEGEIKDLQSQTLRDTIENDSKGIEGRNNEIGSDL